MIIMKTRANSGQYLKMLSNDDEDYINLLLEVLGPLITD